MLMVPVRKTQELNDKIETELIKLNYETNENVQNKLNKNKIPGLNKIEKEILKRRDRAFSTPN